MNEPLLRICDGMANLHPHSRLAAPASASGAGGLAPRPLSVSGNLVTLVLLGVRAGPV
jgi:hypothetical protein